MVLLLAGCESVRSDMRERFSGPTYQSRVVAVEPKPAYDAARAALASINFKFEGGGAAQGKIKAIGPLQPRVNGPGTASQMYADVKLSKALEGGTTVEVLFSELVEDDFNKRPGQGQITPLRSSSLYEVFFRYLDQEIAKPASKSQAGH